VVSIAVATGQIFCLRFLTIFGGVVFGAFIAAWEMTAVLYSMAKALALGALGRTSFLERFVCYAYLK